MKKAFTVIELVMVMVVLGIVASIGADIIVSMYSNYLRSRTVNRLEAQTSIVLEQIAKRLQYRIKESVIARNSGNIKALADPTIDSTYSTLEWIGYSNESHLGTPLPGWSGFIDFDNNETNRTAGTLQTSESNLTEAINIISALTESKIDMTTGKEAALIFKGLSSNFSDFGWGVASNSDGASTLKVKVGATETILQISNDAIPTEIYEQYYLAHTAYAVVPIGVDQNSTDYNLSLYYNYQPWLGKDYNTSGIPSLLAEHVSLFRFRQDESIVRLKLCMHDANETGTGNLVVVCKEKVVY